VTVPRLLLLASKLGYQTRSFAEAAQRLGVEVIVGSDRCHQLDDPWADGAIALHFDQPESSARVLIESLGSRAAGGILALGDRQTATAACAALLMGLRYNPPRAIENCRSKLRQRQVLRAAGLAVPDFCDFHVDEQLENVLPLVRFPSVLKPLRLSASQGVIRANDPGEFRAAAARIKKLLASADVQVMRDLQLDRILVESYIPGAEVAVEGLLSNGKLRVLALFDKPDPLEGPYFEESIYTTPSRLPADAQDAIRECAANTARSLGLTEGPVHAEFRVNEAGPWVLELSPRPIGGLCSRVLSFGQQRMPLEELLVRHALGLPGSDMEREDMAAGVMMIPVPASGTLEAVGGESNAAAVPGIEEVRITARLHDYIAAWPEGSTYLGFLFSRAQSPQDAEAALRRAHAALKFTIAPRLPLAQHN
jgi:biotin carboxylase